MQILLLRQKKVLLTITKKLDFKFDIYCPLVFRVTDANVGNKSSL